MNEQGVAEPLLGSHRQRSRNVFGTSSAIILAVLLLLLAHFVKYTEKHQSDNDVQRFYTWYLHVSRLLSVSFVCYLLSPCYAATSRGIFCQDRPDSRGLHQCVPCLSSKPYLLSQCGNPTVLGKCNKVAPAAMHKPQIATSRCARLSSHYIFAYGSTFNSCSI